MELRQLRYAVGVADHLNFRQASRALHIAQPSLSVQIKQLEDELGVALFIRSKRHVEITRPGKVFLKTAREALAMLDRSVSSARRAERGEVGTPDDQKYKYNGKVIPFDAAKVLPVVDNPKASKYPPTSRAHYLNDNFNYAYTSLLKALHLTFNGQPKGLIQRSPSCIRCGSWRWK